MGPDFGKKESPAQTLVCNNFLKIKKTVPLQALSAFKVSAVSPDCEMKKHTSSLKTGVSRSKNSEAKSNITGNSVSSSSKALVAMAEW